VPQRSAGPGATGRGGDGYAVARDGSPIYYRVLASEIETENKDHDPERDGRGRIEGEPLPLVLSDGIGCDGYVWKYLERALREGRRIVHWHYRGHGRTPEPRDRQRVSMADLADDLASVMDAADVEQAVLVGHSMGVQVCLETYRRYRDRVGGLVLMCGAYGHPLRTFRGRRTLEAALPWIAFGVNRAPHLIQAVWRNLVPTRLAFALAARTEINAELIRLEDFMPYLEHIAGVDLPLFLDMLAHAGRHSARDVLPTIAVPTLIVAGERDHMTPRDLSEEMHELIPRSRLLIVEGGSHTAPIERPQLVNEAVARFLHEIEAARAAERPRAVTSRM
jgi:pimeloyl-ACP methyl ester carboxylesterase